MVIVKKLDVYEFEFLLVIWFLIIFIRCMWMIFENMYCLSIIII